MKEGRRSTDSTLRIRDRYYHIECQSNPDSAIVIRMIEYDFSIALEQVRKIHGTYVMDFPRSCVLYLRHTKYTKDAEEVEIRFPGGERFHYSVPVIKVQEYTKDKLFQKNCLILRNSSHGLQITYSLMSPKQRKECKPDNPS